MYGYDQVNGNNHHEQRIKTEKKIIFWYDSLAKLSSGGSSCYSLIETIF